MLAKTESDQLEAVDQTYNQQKKSLMKYRQFTTRSLSHLKSIASCNFRLKDKMIMLGKPFVELPTKIHLPYQESKITQNEED